MQKTKFCGEVCFLVVVALFVELVNTIRAWADAIRKLSNILIVFSNIFIGLVGRGGLIGELLYENLDYKPFSQP